MNDPGKCAPLSRLGRTERNRRRTIAAGIAGLVLLAFSPYVGHHPVFSSGAGAGGGHLVALCLVAIQAIVQPVHDAFHLLLLIGVGYAAGDRLLALKRSRQALSLLASREPVEGELLWSSARAAGIDPRRVRLAEGLPGAAMTIGWWTPIIYVAEETVRKLTPPQLAAVLGHEGMHLRRRDPLRLSMLRFLSCTLFWMPALRGLAADAADEAEILADDAAAADDPLALASALIQVSRFSAAAVPVTAVGFHSRTLLERRVLRLLGEEPAPETHLTPRSALAAAVTLFLIVGTSSLAAHQPPDGNVPHALEHCHDHDVPVAPHLFCPFDHPAGREGHCPDES